MIFNFEKRTLHMFSVLRVTIITYIKKTSWHEALFTVNELSWCSLVIKVTPLGNSLLVGGGGGR